MERVFNILLLVAAMVICILFGMAMTATLPSGLKLDQLLTLGATITAAIGTWAVGVGAMHYAERAHGLRLSENRQAYQREFIELRARIVNIESAMLVYLNIVKMCDGTPSSIESRHTAVHAIADLLPRSPLGIAGILAEEDRSTCHTIDVSIVMFRVSSSQFLKSYPLPTASTVESTAECTSGPEILRSIWPTNLSEPDEQNAQAPLTEQTAHFLHIVAQLKSISKLAKDLTKSLDKKQTHLGPTQ